ncbi:hypothetical protein GCM10010975_36100 [Comamonas phosphati]|nr:hypothetical protein GCM10010975_36100 [Comamonas phosphati]
MPISKISDGPCPEIQGAISVSADLVPGVLEDAAKAGIKNAIVFSSGFSDLGNDMGRAKQARLVEQAQALGIRLLGPNCTGVVNVHTGAACNILPSIVDLPMVQPGTEMIIGARLDPQFGPMVVYGFGGVWVEVLKDVAVSQAPVGRNEVLAKLAKLQLYPLLTGVRGAMARDIEAFADMVVNVSRTIAANSHWISEIDVNPVILHDRGGVAVDALMAVH